MYLILAIQYSLIGAACAVGITLALATISCAAWILRDIGMSMWFTLSGLASKK